jgi:phosphatidylglycerol:prolipoprotein diacylglycerol transferase
MVHDLSPFLWQIKGDFGIRWYGLSYMLGFIVAYLLARWIIQKQRMGLTIDQLGDFATYCAIGTLVGGRLGYCLFYAPELFLQFKSSLPFWGVLAVNEGGMASHGGIIGLVLTAIIYSKRTGIPPLYLCDLICFGGTIGVGFGRIANFINGELIGRPASPGFPLAVKFPQDMYQWPATDTERLSQIADVVAMVPGSEQYQQISREKWLELVSQYKVDPGAKAQVHYWIQATIDAIQHGQQQIKSAIEPFLIARHPSQLYAAMSEGFLIFIILFLMWRNPRKPGVIGSWFLILYSIGRVTNEMFRMPDAHIGFQLFGLTRGQWLSIAMLISGFVCLFLFGNRSAFAVHGWGHDHSVRLHRK